MSGIAMSLRGVSRRFGKNIANDEVDLEVRSGSVHAVVGENGAGKSTLMKIAYGQIRADAGEMHIKSKAVPLARHSPVVAIEHGIGMVHQHFMLVASMTVVENVVLGREPTRGPFLQLEGARKKLRELSRKYGLEVDADARIEDLSVGEQQRVEIVKVLYQGCDILILDEPTAVLTPREVQQLFDVLRVLVAEGMSVVMITHKLDEVVALADDITVMRRGKVVAKLSGKGASVEAIAQAMVGRSVLLQVDKHAAKPGLVALDIKSLHAPSDAGTAALTDVSLRVRAGEIVGVAGVEGNGQSELQECIVGLRKAAYGRIFIKGENVTRLSVGERYDRGLAHVPEDRHARAIVLEFTTGENLILGRHHEFSGRLLMDRNAVATEARARIKEADIRPPDPETRAFAMSGGNQQKIVMARELNRPGNAILVCAQPTRGVDIGAIEQIHRQIIAARDAGLAILLFSAELAELQSLCDSMVVMYGGKIVLRMDAEELAAENARDRLGAAMTGASV